LESKSVADLYQIDTGWGCGGIFVENGIIVGGAPIFKKLFGETLDKIRRTYKTTMVKSFSIIVSGSREGKLSSSDRFFLKSLSPTLVIHGGQTGIDTEAKEWATENNIPHKPFEANWGKYGNKAGPIRNTEMAKFLCGLEGEKAVVLFKGGKGTNSMKTISKDHGLPIIDRGSVSLTEKINNIVSDWTGCQSCNLHRRRTWQVWGRTVGELAKGGLVIVGEAPGEQEDRGGEAFIGPAGDKLDYLLDEAGIDICFITNAVLCRPPNNRNPKNSEMKKCFGRLQRFLVELEPKVIVTAGKYSSNFLLENDTTMGGMVKNVYKWNLGKLLSSIIIPVYHPAYLIKKGSDSLDDETLRRLSLAWKVVNASRKTDDKN
jgi:uracil-DNA glycosylase family 4